MKAIKYIDLMIFFSRKAAMRNNTSPKVLTQDESSTINQTENKPIDIEAPEPTAVQRTFNTPNDRSKRQIQRDDVSDVTEEDVTSILKLALPKLTSVEQASKVTLFD